MNPTDLPVGLSARELPRTSPGPGPMPRATAAEHPCVPRTLAVRVHIPAVQPGELRHALRATLRAMPVLTTAPATTPAGSGPGHTPAPPPPAQAPEDDWYRTRSGSWALTVGGLRAVLKIPWDGPELDIRCDISVADPLTVSHLLAEVARRLRDGVPPEPSPQLHPARAHRAHGAALSPAATGPSPLRRRHASSSYPVPTRLWPRDTDRTPAEVAHLALRAMFGAWEPAAPLAVLSDGRDAAADPARTRPRPRVLADPFARAFSPATTWREALTSPVTGTGTGTGTGHPGGTAPAPEPAFAFSYVGPPLVPAGWLLLSWSYPVTEAIHFTLGTSAGHYRLHAESTGTPDKPRLDRLITTWRTTLQRAASAPDTSLAELCP
ncbi:hypothetical protein [Streptomyces daliensis]|uniref:Uncharacterized protein n=1 Tax=Streptomyces daliensis TaxID=299421 RepID=A0A8T4IQ76_9ACTN|nr:hypothetical protein [Streptomyces daliensis]